MRSVVSPHIVLDREIAPFAAALLAGAAAAPAGVPIAEQRRHAALLRQRWTVGGPMMERRRDGLADTSRGPVGFRIHYPSRDDRLPTLVYLHGGGWTFLDLDTHDRVMHEFAARSGWAVVGVDYPLAPEAPFPAAIEHCAALIGWLGREAAAFGLDADILHDENIELAARLREAGSATQAVVYLGTTHAFLEAAAVAEISRRAIAEAGGWLATLAAPG